VRIKQTRSEIKLAICCYFNAFAGTLYAFARKPLALLKLPVQGR